jgi:hypothetical protein
VAEKEGVEQEGGAADNDYMARAGGSARREYKRRLARHRRRVRRTLPFLAVALAVGVPIAWVLGERAAPGAGVWIALVVGAGLVKELWPSRRHVDAWATGAKGEAKTGRALARLGDEFVVLHDRRIPGSRANIDHIAVGPAGIFTVDAKQYSGKLEVRARGRELWIKGRNRSKLLQRS